MKVRWVLAVAFVFVIAMAGSAEAATIYVNTTGWWINASQFNESSTPIQSALDNASAGDLITIVEITDYAENLNFGTGVNDSITLDLNGSTLNGTGLTGYGITISSKNNIRIENGTIKGFSDAIHFSGNNANITLRNLTIQNPGARGIYLDYNSHGTNITIEDVTITNANNEGIAKDSYAYLDGLTLRNVTITSPGGTGISLSDDSSRWIKNIVLDNVTVTGASYSGVDVSMYWNANSANITIINSNFSNNNQHGISLRARGVVRIENNTMKNNGGSYYGLYIQGSNNPTVILNNNTIENNGNGVYLSYVNNIILPATNTIRNNGGYAYSLNNMNNVTVKDTSFDNSVRGYTFAIYASNVNNFLAENLTITNSSNNAIHFAGTDTNITLRNLTIQNPGARGIYLDYNSHGTNITIEDVTITNANNEGIAKDSYAYLDGLTLRNVTITSPGGTGISLSDDSSRWIKNIVLDNVTVTGASYSGVDVSMYWNANSANITIINSNFSNNNQHGISLRARGVVRIENNTMKNNGGSYYGLYIQGSNNPTVILNNNTIENNGNGVYFSAITTSLNESTISNTANDLYLVSSTISTYNTTFDKSKVTVGRSSTLNVYWYLDLRVIDETLNPVSSASVSIYNATDNLVYSNITDVQGRLPTIALKECTMEPFNTIYESPYTINASKAGVGGNVTAINLNSSMNITLMLMNPPSVTVLSPQNTTYTSSTIQINVSASDVSGVAAVKARIDDTTNVTLTNVSGYWVNQTTLSDGTHSIRFYAYDTYGNVNSSQSVEFGVDLLPPSITFVQAPANNSIVNHSVTILVNVSDSVSNVSTAIINVNGANHTMTKLGSGKAVNFSYSITGDGDYTYRIYANDSVNWWNASETRAFTIDTTPPQIIISYSSQVYRNSSANLTVRITDVHPNRYVVYRNGSIVESGSYGSNSFNITINTTALGFWNYTIKANDTAGNENSTSVMVEVKNNPPVATFSFTPASPRKGQSVEFDASSSYDVDGSIASYAWDFGDGSTAFGVIVTHAYTSAGTYTVKLTVMDNDGGTNSSSVKITVKTSTFPKPAAGGGAGGGAVFTSPHLEAPSELKYTDAWVFSAGKESTLKLSSKITSACDVIEVKIRPKETVALAYTISKVKSLPEGVPKLSYDTYRLFEISFVKYGTETEVHPIGVIKFRVAKSWLEKRGYRKDQISLMEYSGNKWIEYPAKVTGEDNSYVYYESNIKSFSIFAVVAKSAKTTRVKPSHVPSHTGTQTPPQTQPQQKQVSQVKTGKRTPGFDVSVLVAVTCLLVIARYRKL